MSIRVSTFIRSATGTATAVVLAAALAGPVMAGPGAAGPPATAPPAARGSVPATGTITVVLDPLTLSATPIHGGAHCLFRVEAVLELDGTVDGSATGTTEATIHAPCEDAIANPPGTFADTFAFTGEFVGTVAGVDSTAEVRYAGVTRAGGEVFAVLFLDGDARVVAPVRATVADGGTYRGIATTP